MFNYAVAWALFLWTDPALTVSKMLDVYALRWESESILRAEPEGCVCHAIRT